MSRPLPAVYVRIDISSNRKDLSGALHRRQAANRLTLSAHHRAVLERVGQDPNAASKGLMCLSVAMVLLAYRGMNLVKVSEGREGSRLRHVL